MRPWILPPRLISLWSQLLLRQLLRIWLICHRTVGVADAAGGTKIRVNVSGSLVDFDFEIAAFSFDADQVCVGDHLDVQMPADLDQFGRDDSHGAFVGGEGLVKLRHYAADGRGLL
jgi:hypothetical protein